MKKKIFNAAMCSTLGACVLMMSAGCSAGGTAENGSQTVKGLKNADVTMSDSVETVRLSDRTENPFEIAEEKIDSGNTSFDDNGCDKPIADNNTAEAANGNDTLMSDTGAAKPAELTDDEINAIGTRKFEDVFGSNANGNSTKKTKLQTAVFDKLKGDNIHFAVIEYSCACSGENDNSASSARVELQRQGDKQVMTIEYDFGSDSYSDTTIIKDGKVYELDNHEKTYYIDKFCMDDLYMASIIGDFDNWFSYTPSLEGTMEINGESVAYEVYELYSFKSAVYFLRDDYCKIEMYDGMSGLLCGYETITLDMPINEALFDIPTDYTEDKDLCDDCDELDEIADEYYEDDEDEYQWGRFRPDAYDRGDLYSGGNITPYAADGYLDFDRDNIEDYIQESGSYLNGLYRQLYGCLYGENSFPSIDQYNIPYYVGNDCYDDIDEEYCPDGCVKEQAPSEDQIDPSVPICSTRQ